MKKCFHYLLFVFFSCTALNAQEIRFSQFYASPIYLCPSTAGAFDGTRIVANYRDQWPGIPNTYLNYAFSIDHYFPQYNSGLGFLATRDTRGDLGYSTTNLAFDYAYDIKFLKKFHLRPGMQFAYTSNGINLGQIRTRDQMVAQNNAPATFPDFNNNSYIDAAASAIAYYRSYWMGFKVDHLAFPTQVLNSKDPIPLSINFFGGAKFSWNGRPFENRGDNIMLAYNFSTESSFKQLDIGFLMLKKDVEFGMFYRGIPAADKNFGSDAVILCIGYIFQNINFCYSHDFTVSGLSQSSNGANEVSLIILIDKDMQPKKKHKALKCPKF